MSELLVPGHLADEPRMPPEPMFAGFTARHRDRHLIAAFQRDRRRLLDEWLEEAYEAEAAKRLGHYRYLMDWAGRLERGEI